ncbi:unnamed protein product, partial [Prorocentrum cordatum]
PPAEFAELASRFEGLVVTGSRSEILLRPDRNAKQMKTEQTVKAIKREGNAEPIIRWASANIIAEDFDRGVLEQQIKAQIIHEAEETQWCLLHNTRAVERRQSQVCSLPSIYMEREFPPAPGTRPVPVGTAILAALPRVSKLITMTKAARQLQLYPSKGILRDHSPVLLEADLGVPSLRSSQILASWNFDAIETALQTPGLREGFLEEANLALQRAAPSYLGYFESNMIDAGYASFLDALAPIAKKHFGRARRTPGAELAQHRLQVRRFLRGRAVLRAMGLPHCHYDFQIRDLTNRIRWEPLPGASIGRSHTLRLRSTTMDAYRDAGERMPFLGTQILADRLRSARVWHIAVFDDTKNAFGCCEHKRMNQGLLEYLPAGDVALLSDRRTTHLLHLEGVDRPTTLHLQSGALMGDPSAPDEFRVDFARPLQEWLAQFQDPALCVSCPVFGREVYAGLFKYVDDLAYFLLLQEGALSEAVATAREAQAKLGNALAAYGYKQNTSKQVLVPRLCGYKATRQFYAAEVISLLFGRVGFENAPTLSEGRLTVHANPFAVRFVTDVYRLELLTDYGDWRSVWGEDIHALFHDDYISHCSFWITFASGTCLSYLRDGLAMATPKPKWMLEKRPPGAEAEGAPVLAKAKGGGPPQKDKGGKSSAPTPGSASDAAAASGPNSKQQRNRHLGQIKDMGFTKKQANFINVMVKQTLMTTQLVRELWAAGVDTYFLTADLPEIEAAQEAGATYSHEVRARGKGHQLGPPHLHIFNGFVTKLLERGPALGQRTHAMLKDWHGRVWCELQPHDLYDMVRLFRVTKCYDQNKRKLHLMMRDVAQPSVPPESDEQQLPSPLTVRGLLQKALEEIGGRRALGAAPPGAMEEILQNAVDAKDSRCSKLQASGVPCFQLAVAGLPRLDSWHTGLANLAADRVLGLQTIVDGKFTISVEGDFMGLDGSNEEAVNTRDGIIARTDVVELELAKVAAKKRRTPAGAVDGGGAPGAERLERRLEEQRLRRDAMARGQGGPGPRRSSRRGFDGADVVGVSGTVAPHDGAELIHCLDP